MDRAQAYGLTKEAADDLYKEAGVTSTLVQAARAAGRRLASQGDPLGARSLQRNVGLMLGQRAFAHKYNTDALGAQIKKLYAAHAARSKFISRLPPGGPLRDTGSLISHPHALENAHRALIYGNQRLPDASFRELYPHVVGRRAVFNDLRAALGRPMRDNFGYEY